MCNKTYIKEANLLSFGFRKLVAKMKKEVKGRDI